MIPISQESACVRDDYIRYLKPTEKWEIQGLGFRSIKPFARIEVYIKNHRLSVIADCITGQLYPPTPGSVCLSSEQLKLVRRHV